MIKHIHYPTDMNSWTLAEKDEFREFRHDMGDVLKDCVRILGEDEALSLALDLLSPFINNDGSLPQNIQWQTIEAPLFSLRAMGSEISKKESTWMPKIMQLIPSLPAHPKVRYSNNTFFTVVGTRLYSSLEDMLNGQNTILNSWNTK
jgi:transportin-3